MDGNVLRQELPPASPDLSCTNSFTRSILEEVEEEEPYLTVDDSKYTFRQIQDKCTTWTNEKHSLYIGHLESSFVEQLHRSMNLSVWCSEHKREGPGVSQRLLVNGENTSEQLKVLQDGSSKKIEFKRNRPSTTAVEPRVLKKLRIHHLRYVDKSRILTAAHTQKCNLVPTWENCLGGKRISTNDSASLNQIPLSLCNQDDSLNYTEEFSDQNFPDEGGKGKSSTCLPKRSKNSVDDIISTDQMVPVGRSRITDASASSPPHQEKKKIRFKNGYKSLINVNS